MAHNSHVGRMANHQSWRECYAYLPTFKVGIVPGTSTSVSPISQLRQYHSNQSYARCWQEGHLHPGVEGALPFVLWSAHDAIQCQAFTTTMPACGATASCTYESLSTHRDRKGRAAHWLHARWALNTVKSNLAYPYIEYAWYLRLCTLLPQCL
jgi:hypothetical protein